MEVIQGLHVDIPGQELKELMLERLGYHKRLVAKLEKKSDEISTIEEEMEDESAEISKLSNAGYATSFKEGLKKHKDQVIYYHFMVGHVNVNAIYRLNEQELRRLGIQPPDRHY
jgi:hypothetical protein